MGSIERKIQILGEASKYDVCASMASPRKESFSNRIGSPDKAGICHAFAPDGRCISLFKVLMTNYCLYDCKYCVNNSGNAKEKVMFEPSELAKAFMGLYIRNYVEGLFLSSGVWRSADHTTEKILDTLQLIREKYKFRGYLHVKILPGTSRDNIKQIIRLADRVSLNVELPSASRMKEVTSNKNYTTDIIKCQKQIQDFYKDGNIPAGHTTQFIVGTVGETDYEILEQLHWEYQNVDLKRGYFSAFDPIKGTPLEKVKPIQKSARRENFLYRTDWLYRKYNYSIEEIYSILDDNGMIPLQIDPKLSLALEDETFPLDINEASYEQLIRIPGIGELSAQRIINLRKEKKQIESYTDLKRVGVVVKRAKSFMIVNGKRAKRLTEFF